MAFFTPTTRTGLQSALKHYDALEDTFSLVRAKALAAAWPVLPDTWPALLDDLYRASRAAIDVRHLEAAYRDYHAWTFQQSPVPEALMSHTDGDLCFILPRSWTGTVILRPTDRCADVYREFDGRDPVYYTDLVLAPWANTSVGAWLRFALLHGDSPPALPTPDDGPLIEPPFTSDTLRYVADGALVALAADYPHAVAAEQRARAAVRAAASDLTALRTVYQVQRDYRHRVGYSEYELAGGADERDANDWATFEQQIKHLHKQRRVARSRARRVAAQKGATHL